MKQKQRQPQLYHYIILFINSSNYLLLNIIQTHYFYLGPFFFLPQSVLSDVSTLTSDGDWSHEERLILESRIVAATQGPLCLDPNPIPSLASTRLRQSKALLADHQLVRQAKKFSQVCITKSFIIVILITYSYFIVINKSIQR